MSERKITRSNYKEAVIGGAFLGGGGGGPKEEGLRYARLSFECGDPSIQSLNQVGKNGKIVTVSALGAPGTETSFPKPTYYVKAVDLLQKTFDISIAGLISCEIGGFAIVNGWFQSAILGIPVIDAPCDGRAHPTGQMGSLSLEKEKNYTSKQAVVGINPKNKVYLEATYRGDLANVATMVRKTADQIGGLVAVARNPVSSTYLKKHAAQGAIQQALGIGKQIKEKKQEGFITAIESLNGEVVAQGTVTSKTLKTKNGFDVGTIHVSQDHDVELTFWNEYMTLEENNSRIATFPDLIVTADSETGIPNTTAEIEEGDPVIVGYVPKENIALGSGVSNKTNLKEIEEAIDKDILQYLA